MRNRSLTNYKNIYQTESKYDTIIQSENCDFGMDGLKSDIGITKYLFSNSGFCFVFLFSRESSFPSSSSLLYILPLFHYYIFLTFHIQLKPLSHPVPVCILVNPRLFYLLLYSLIYLYNSVPIFFFTWILGFSDFLYLLYKCELNELIKALYYLTHYK